jgi:hypothetical protein
MLLDLNDNSIIVIIFNIYSQLKEYYLIEQVALHENSFSWATQNDEELD